MPVMCARIRNYTNQRNCESYIHNFTGLYHFWSEFIFTISLVCIIFDPCVCHSHCNYNESHSHENNLTVIWRIQGLSCRFHKQRNENLMSCLTLTFKVFLQVFIRQLMISLRDMIVWFVVHHNFFFMILGLVIMVPQILSLKCTVKQVTKGGVATQGSFQYLGLRNF